MIFACQLGVVSKTFELEKFGMTPLREVLRPEPELCPHTRVALPAGASLLPPSSSQGEVCTSPKSLSQHNLRHQLHHHFVSVRLNLTSATEATIIVNQKSSSNWRPLRCQLAQGKLRMTPEGALIDFDR